MELKKYLLKMIKKIKDPETIIRIYLKVKEITGGKDGDY